MLWNLICFELINTYRKEICLKIALRCFSPLLQSGLDFFLKDYHADESMCDFVMTDEPQNLQTTKPVCIISDGKDSHIRKPFSAQTLIEDLQKFYENLQVQKMQQQMKKSLDGLLANEDMPLFEPPMSAPSYPYQAHLEAEITSLAREFAMKVVNLLQERQK